MIPSSAKTRTKPPRPQLLRHQHQEHAPEPRCIGRLKTSAMGCWMSRRCFSSCLRHKRRDLLPATFHPNIKSRTSFCVFPSDRLVKTALFPPAPSHVHRSIQWRPLHGKHKYKSTDIHVLDSECERRGHLQKSGHSQNGAK